MSENASLADFGGTTEPTPTGSSAGKATTQLVNVANKAKRMTALSLIAIVLVQFTQVLLYLITYGQV